MLIDFSPWKSAFERGVYPLDWADGPESDLEAGERA
jgi:hypothetical protein